MFTKNTRKLLKKALQRTLANNQKIVKESNQVVDKFLSEEATYEQMLNLVYNQESSTTYIEAESLEDIAKKVNIVNDIRPNVINTQAWYAFYKEEAAGRHALDCVAEAVAVACKSDNDAVAFNWINKWVALHEEFKPTGQDPNAERSRLKRLWRGIWMGLKNDVRVTLKWMNPLNLPNTMWGSAVNLAKQIARKGTGKNPEASRDFQKLAMAIKNGKIKSSKEYGEAKNQILKKHGLNQFKLYGKRS